MLYELFTFGQLPYTTFTNKKVFAKVTKYVVHSYMYSYLKPQFSLLKIGDIDCLSPRTVLIKSMN